MFEQEIRQLATEIRGLVIDYKGTHPNASRKLVQVQRPDVTLKYREDLGLANDLSPKRIEEDIWDWRDEQYFHESVVKALANYKSLESVVGGEGGSLGRFARDLCLTSFQGLDDEELEKRVNAFGRELAGQPLPVTVTAYIDGLSIRESPLVISDRFVLRRPTLDDVTEYVVLDENGGFTFPLKETWFRVVGDFVFDAVYTGLAQTQFLRTLEALRLFRVGGVSSNRYSMRSRHTLPGGTLGGAGFFSRYSYELGASDCASLDAFLCDTVPLLPDTLESGKAIGAVEIAHARYRDALFQGGLPEKEITSAISALEALFLDGEQELRHRLAQRIAVFLRLLGTQVDAVNTYDIITKGYKIRSKFIHGSSLKPEGRPRADSLARDLMEIARRCVLAFFQLKTNKDKLLAQLDRAMIDPTSATGLRTSLRSVAYR